ncbi:hypothetical protein AVEN_92814-1 [Araneus ventricosus]|uniref:Uncharacterized protein n=1 Tax=Araneus ventricosus TaxID=182803 RepID=A0A4Y2IVK5_ARAVE|nr:hypothetical protein AVEN_92814-1 [Araneus ventricosus]
MTRKIFIYGLLFSFVLSLSKSVDLEKYDVKRGYDMLDKMNKAIAEKVKTRAQEIMETNSSFIHGGTLINMMLTFVIMYYSTETFRKRLTIALFGWNIIGQTITQLAWIAVTTIVFLNLKVMSLIINPRSSESILFTCQLIVLLM